MRRGASPTTGSNFNTIQQNTISYFTTLIRVGAPTLDTTTGNVIRQNTFQDSFYGVRDYGIGTTIGSGAVANTFIQVDNFVLVQ